MKRLVGIVAAGALCTAALIVFGVTLSRAVFYDPQVELGVSAAVSTTTSPADVPVRLAIPTLSIDARVVPVGIVKGSRMAAPSSFSDVAWYKYGPAPGALGSAVMAGHLDNGLRLAGVFKHLSDIQPGADISVTAAGGEVRHFVVVGLSTYPYDRVPATVFTASEGSLLTLVTCAGHLIRLPDKEWSYDKRLVVYARLMKS